MAHSHPSGPGVAQGISERLEPISGRFCLVSMHFGPAFMPIAPAVGAGCCHFCTAFAHLQSRSQVSSRPVFAMFFRPVSLMSLATTSPAGAFQFAQENVGKNGPLGLENCLAWGPPPVSPRRAAGVSQLQFRPPCACCWLFLADFCQFWRD